MYVIVWQYEVGEVAREQFEECYGPFGLWAEFFSRDDGFVYTTLLGGVRGCHRFFTLDFWKTRSDFARFKAENHREYRAIDEATMHLTRSEQRIGAWEF